MKSFKAIVLDLFDTLVNWDPDGLPVMHWKGREMHSTLPWILPEGRRSARRPNYDQDAFMTAYATVYEEINAERERDGIEITCLDRFARTLQRLTAHPSRTRSNWSELAEELTRIHMRGVRAVTSAPAAARGCGAPPRRDTIASGCSRISTIRQPAGKSWLDTGVNDIFEADHHFGRPRPAKTESANLRAMLAMLHLDAARRPLRRRHAAS